MMCDRDQFNRVRGAMYYLVRKNPKRYRMRWVRSTWYAGHRELYCEEDKGRRVGGQRFSAWRELGTFTLEDSDGK